MNWLTFALASWVCFGFEMGLRTTLEVGGGVSPSFVFVLLVYVSTFAGSTTALWAGVALGVVMDLTSRVAIANGGGEVVLVGPHVLGYALACQFVLALRGVMNKRNVLSIAALAIFGSVASHAVVVAFHAVHRWYGDPILAGTKEELFARLGSAIYTGVAALALSLVLLPMHNAFGFAATGQQRRFGRHVIR